jgi:hypothetical protein
MSETSSTVKTPADPSAADAVNEYGAAPAMDGPVGEGSASMSRHSDKGFDSMFERLDIGE